MFFKIDVLKNFANFAGKHLCWSLFLIKLQVWRHGTLLKRDSNTVAFLSIIKKAVKRGKRCYDQQMKNQFEIKEPPTKSKFRNPGGGRKVTVPENGEALYDYFIDVRGSLKARLPRSLFKAQASFFYDNWWSQQSEVKKQPSVTF